MARQTRLSYCTNIIHYLVNAPDTGRTLSEISFATKISYSTVRRVLTEYYPHCFSDYNSGGSWYNTGEPPVKDLPFDFTPPSDAIHNLPADTPHKQVTIDDKERKSGWTWNQNAIRYLDGIFPGGKTLAQTIEDAAKTENGLGQLEIVGKTLTRAAQEMKRNGKVDW